MKVKKKNNVNMKKILFLLGICICSGVFSQKSSLDYFNEASTLYIQNKKNDAFFHVKRGLEVYEDDERLSELYNLIKPEDEPPHQCQNPQQQDKKEDGDQNQQNQGGSGSQGDQQQDSQEQSDAQNNNSDNSDESKSSQKSDSENSEDSHKDDSASGDSDELKNNDSAEESERAQKEKEQSDDKSQEGGFSQINDANAKEQKEGQISTMEAEMLLRAIEDKDKELQIRLQQQKSQKSNRTTVEKDW